MAAPVDRYGVGTSLVTGSGAPTAGMVYKLVERDGVPVAKKSEGKALGGRPQVRRPPARRRPAPRWPRWSAARRSSPGDGDRDLVVPLVRGRRACSPGRPVEALAQARAHHERARAALPPEAWALSRGEPALETVTAEEAR